MRGADRSGTDGCPVVVLIDDDEDARFIYRVMLSTAGLEVVTANDETAGLVACRVARPDVILLDIDLPTFASFLFAQFVRQEPELRHARIIALTCRAWEGESLALHLADFDRVFLKPVLPDDVRAAVLAATNDLNRFARRRVSGRR